MTQLVKRVRTRRFRRKKQTLKSKIMRIGRALGNKELKWYSGSGSDLISTTTMVGGLALIDNGSGVSNRVGNDILIRSIEIRFHFANDGQKSDYGAKTTDPRDYGRVMMVVDHEMSGANPVMFGTTLNAVLNGSNILAQPFYPTKSRFTILRDKFICATPQIVNLEFISGAVVGQDYSRNQGGKVFSWRKYWKNGMRMKFNGTGHTAAELGNNQIFLMYSGTPSYANSGLQLEWFWTIVFSDI